MVVDPNLVVWESFIWGNDPATKARLDPGSAVAEVARNPNTPGWDEVDFQAVQAIWPLFLDMVRRFHEAGIPLTAGSDFGNAWITPGPALHRELELLVSAGFPEHDVLRMATVVPAQVLGAEHELGCLEKGCVADLVVLTRNPLEDIRNTRLIEAVYRAGRRVATGTTSTR